MITLDQIVEAGNRLAPFLKPSPLVHSNHLSQRFGKDIFLKLENLQDTGSFKVRGALNHMLCLPKSIRGKGVVAASAGNHAQGVAWAAKQLDIPATVYMPRVASIAKLLATRSYGATVLQVGDTYDETVKAAKERILKDTASFVPAFNDPYVIAGQGTVGLEILEQLPEVDTVIVPAGGGGLLAGIALSIKSNRQHLQVLGVQAAQAPSIARSLERGQQLTATPKPTLADGIAVATPGELTFPIIQKHVDQVLTVDEKAIENAVITFLERKHLVVEGAGAAPLALLLEGKASIKGRRIALVVSGGNLDLQMMDRIIHRGSLSLGRRMRLRVLIPDMPGSLHQVTGMIARHGANVLQVYHYRLLPEQPLNVSQVDFELEIEGHKQAEEILNTLETAGVQIIR
jgi:threonine dehydratase